MSETDFFDEDLSQKRGRTAMNQGVETVRIDREDVPNRPVSDLNLTRMAKRREEANVNVAQAKLELERLRHRQAELERAKQSLEDLSRKQDDYAQGKQELVGRLNDSMAGLETQEEQASRMAAIYAGTRKRFAELLQELQGIDDSNWPDETFRDELGKAVIQIEAIRKEYINAMASVETAGGTVAAPVPTLTGTVAADTRKQPGFGYWFKVGLAVTLPLMALLVVLAIVFASLGHA